MRKIVNILPANKTFFRFSVLDSEIYEGIVNHFSFDTPKYFKTGYDKISLVKNRCLFYVGLFNEFIEYLERNDIQYKIHGKILEREKISDTVLRNFIDGIKLKHDLHFYQFDAIKSVIENKREVVLSPTSSGKSLIISALLAYFMCKNQNTDKKALVIVPNCFLVNQLFAQIKEYFENSFPLEKLVQKVHGDIPEKERDLSKPIILTTWQSQRNTNSKFLELFETRFLEKVDMVLYDEVQYSPAKESKSVIESTINASYKVGFTGTLYDDNEYRNTVIKAMFGDVVSSISTREMIDFGFASKIKVYSINLKSSSTYQPMDYFTEVETLKESENYMRYVLSFISKEFSDGNTLVLHRGVKYGMKCAEYFARLNPNRKVYVINGSIKPSERERIRKLLETVTGAVVFATYETTAQGVSINNLNYGVLLEGMKSNIKVLQSLGRMLRKHPEKEYAFLFDFVPEFINKRGDQYLKQHGDKRLSYYRREQHELEVISKKFDF